MTPKEKAVELVEKMWVYALPNENGTCQKNAKQCALIAVDEIIEMYNELNVNGFLKPNSIGFIIDEVKKEIENF
jgi:hypothetical protein